VGDDLGVSLKLLPSTTMSFQHPLPISVSDERVIGSSFRLLSFAWCASLLFIPP
jgi:hypothetical protein